MTKPTIASLTVENNNLKQKIAEMKETLYEEEILQRPTMMSAIEDKEKAAFETIEYIIMECEKETGRVFDLGHYYFNSNICPKEIKKPPKASKPFKGF